MNDMQIKFHTITITSKIDENSEVKLTGSPLKVQLWAHPVKIIYIQICRHALTITQNLTSYEFILKLGSQPTTLPLLNSDHILHSIFLS